MADEAGASHLHVTATGTEHPEDPAVWFVLEVAHGHDRLRNLAPMVLRYVDADHRLVNHF